MSFTTSHNHNQPTNQPPTQSTSTKPTNQPTSTNQPPNHNHAQQPKNKGFSIPRYQGIGPKHAKIQKSDHLDGWRVFPIEVGCRSNQPLKMGKFHQLNLLHHNVGLDVGGVLFSDVIFLNWISLMLGDIFWIFIFNWK